MLAYGVVSTTILGGLLSNDGFSGGALGLYIGETQFHTLALSGCSGAKNGGTSSLGGPCPLYWYGGGAGCLSEWDIAVNGSEHWGYATWSRPVHSPCEISLAHTCARDLKSGGAAACALCAATNQLRFHRAGCSQLDIENFCIRSNRSAADAQCVLAPAPIGVDRAAFSHACGRGSEHTRLGKLVLHAPVLPA